MCAEHGHPRSSRSSPGWRAGSGPASAASSRPGTATSACASRGRYSTRPCSKRPPWSAIDASPSAASSSPTRSSTARARSTRSPRGAAFGHELIQRFPFAALVTKTVTVAPRQGNPPPRLWELPAGLMNSIGLPNKGLERFAEEDLPELAAAPCPADRQRDGLHARGGRDAGRGVRRPRRGLRARAERLLPERRNRARDGRGPMGGLGAARAGPAADREAADREADPERDRRPGRRPGGRGGGSERAVADQHAQGDGARPGHRRAMARRRHRRRLRPRGEGDLARSGQFRRARPWTFRWLGWAASRRGATRSI